jgi:hypothetical protein
VAVSLSPIDLVAANPWRRTIFTTYALSLSFFEAVVLDALVRGGGQDSLKGNSRRSAQSISRERTVFPNRD